jgi:hypothetical protein
MQSSIVNTPDGPMRTASALRPAGAVLTDFLMVSLLTAPFAQLAGVQDGPSALIWVCGVVGYCLLAFGGAVPSLGLWALGVRRYTYDQVAEYAGPGVLYVYEDLPSRVYAYRTVMSALLLLLLAGVDLIFTQILPNGFI